METITSLKNDRVKLVRALQSQSKARRREGKMVLEGARLLQDALQSGLIPDFVFYQGDQDTLSRQSYRVFRELMQMGIPCLAVTFEIMQHITDVETPQNILGVFDIPQLPIPESPSLVVVIDQLRNPGNAGSILRTAAAAAADLMIVTPNTVEPFSPKVLRGGMGAHFRLPIWEADWPEIALEFGQLNSYVTDSGGETPYYAIDWLRPSMIIISSEAHGPGQGARQVAGSSVRIPMAAGTESLNAAVAAGIILYEVQRQRILSTRDNAKT